MPVKNPQKVARNTMYLATSILCIFIADAKSLRDRPGLLHSFSGIMKEIPQDERRLRDELAQLVRAGLHAHLTAPLADLLTVIDLKGLKRAKVHGSIERGRWRRNPLVEHPREAEMRYWRTVGTSKAYSFEFRTATIIYTLDTIARDLRSVSMNPLRSHRQPSPLLPIEIRNRIAALLEQDDGDEFIAAIDMLTALSDAWRAHLGDTPNTQYLDMTEIGKIDL